MTKEQYQNTVEFLNALIEKNKDELHTYQKIVRYLQNKINMLQNLQILKFLINQTMNILSFLLLLILTKTLTTQ